MSNEFVPRPTLRIHGRKDSIREPFEKVANTATKSKFSATHFHSRQVFSIEIDYPGSVNFTDEKPQLNRFIESNSAAVKLSRSYCSNLALIPEPSSLCIEDLLVSLYFLQSSNGVIVRIIPGASTLPAAIRIIAEIVVIPPLLSLQLLIVVTPSFSLVLPRSSLVVSPTIMIAGFSSLTGQRGYHDSSEKYGYYFHPCISSCQSVRIDRHS